MRCSVKAVLLRKRPNRLQIRIVITLLVIVVTACGGEMSLTEYVDEVNDAVVDAEAMVTLLEEEGVLAEDPTPQEVAIGIRRGLDEIRIPLQEAIDTIDPPAEVAELHALLWTWHAEFIRVESEVAQRIAGTPDTEEGWTQASNSAEMAAYRASLAEGKQVCIDFQAELDATEARGVFGDAPWLPRQLSEVVDAALGCQWFPDDPESVYRYP